MQYKHCWHSGLTDLEVATEKKKASGGELSCPTSLCTQCAKVLSLMNINFSQNIYEFMVAVFLLLHISACFLDFTFSQCILGPQQLEIYNVRDLKK